MSPEVTQCLLGAESPGLRTGAHKDPRGRSSASTGHATFSGCRKLREADEAFVADVADSRFRGGAGPEPQLVTVRSLIQAVAPSARGGAPGQSPWGWGPCPGLRVLLWRVWPPLVPGPQE